MDEQDNTEYLRAVSFLEKVKKEIPGIDIKIYPDFSKEYMPYSKGNHRLPLVIADGKIISEGEYPEIGDLKRLLKYKK